MLCTTLTEQSKRDSEAYVTQGASRAASLFRSMGVGWTCVTLDVSKEHVIQVSGFHVEDKLMPTSTFSDINELSELAHDLVPP